MKPKGKVLDVVLWAGGIVGSIVVVGAMIVMIVYGMTSITANIYNVEVIKPEPWVECVVASTAEGIAINCNWDEKHTGGRVDGGDF